MKYIVVHCTQNGNGHRFWQSCSGKVCTSIQSHLGQPCSNNYLGPPSFGLIPAKHKQHRHTKQDDKMGKRNQETKRRSQPLILSNVHITWSIFKILAWKCGGEKIWEEEAKRFGEGLPIERKGEDKTNRVFAVGSFMFSGFDLQDKSNRTSRSGRVSRTDRVTGFSAQAYHYA